MTKLDYYSINWKEVVYYSEESPSGLIWIKNVGKMKIGDLAGSKSHNSNGSPKCWDLRYNGKLWKVHRIICILFNMNLNSEDEVNHIDVNPFNNNILNLEIVSRKLNMRRCASHVGKSVQSDNVTGTNGVSERTINNELKAYCSSYIDLDGKRHMYYFSVARYGKILAKKLAETTRIHFIDELNKQGAGYG